MLAASSRQHAGNEGYDDNPATRYAWDETVPNHDGPAAGDVVLLWDKVVLLGVSVIEQIHKEKGDKLRLRCPACSKTGLKRRLHKMPSYRCHSCRAEFDEPFREELRGIQTYTSSHGDRWIDAGGCLDASVLRGLCVHPGSQHSIREVVWQRARDALATASIRHLVGGLVGTRDEPCGGHRQRIVRVRIGQMEFRARLLGVFGEVCAFTGRQPREVLEAAHLYSFAERGRHEVGGGLLMRRDLHRLFDLGFITVDPDSLEIGISAELRGHRDYAALLGQRLKCPVAAETREWLRAHRIQSEG